MCIHSVSSNAVSKTEGQTKKRNKIKGNILVDGKIRYSMACPS